MDLEQLASIVKSISGVGVVLAVLYLAMQLRQRNRLNQFSRPGQGGLPSFPPMGMGGGMPDLSSLQGGMPGMPPKPGQMPPLPGMPPGVSGMQGLPPMPGSGPGMPPMGYGGGMPPMGYGGGGMPPMGYPQAGLPPMARGPAYNPAMYAVRAPGQQRDAPSLPPVQGGAAGGPSSSLTGAGFAAFSPQ